MQTKFTPGPWKVSTESYPSIAGRITISSESTDDCVASIPAPWLHKQANANLIAAAPKMHQALRSVLEWFDTWEIRIGTAEECLLTEIRSALQEADGGKQ